MTNRITRSVATMQAHLDKLGRKPGPDVEDAASMDMEEYDRDYLNSFIQGVDGPPGAVPDPVGYEDGLAVRAALWPEPANA